MSFPGERLLSGLRNIGSAAEVSGSPDENRHEKSRNTQAEHTGLFLAKR